MRSCQGFRAIKTVWNDVAAVQCPKDFPSSQLCWTCGWQFTELKLSDTYVATWPGFVYVAFVIDAYRIGAAAEIAIATQEPFILALDAALGERVILFVAGPGHAHAPSGRLL